MRRRRIRASMNVWSSAWPMCRDPVTFGGGITMEYAGAGAAASAANRPRATQSSYRRASTSPGAYCGGSWVRWSSVTSGESRAHGTGAAPPSGRDRHHGQTTVTRTKGSRAPAPCWIAAHHPCEPETKAVGRSYHRAWLRTTEGGARRDPGCGGDTGVRRGPAAVRSLVPHRLALTAVMLTAILAATLLSGLASFSATVTSYAVRETLATSPATGILITSSSGSVAAAA